MVEFDSTILGGLPVVVRAEFNRAEPDVGIMSSYYSIEGIYFRPRAAKTGKSKLRPVADAMYEKADRIGDLERLEQEAAGW